jgi:hypothetical protein
MVTPSSMDTSEENKVIEARDIDGTPVSTSTENLNTKSVSCKEYQTLKYQTMINSGTSLEKNVDNETSEEFLNDFLNTDMNKSKKKVWNKLSKTEKIKRINQYVITTFKTKHNLSTSEVSHAKRYLAMALERKKMTKNDEVDYDDDSCTLRDIYSILFNEKTRKFTLNKDYTHSKKNRSSGSNKASSNNNNTPNNCKRSKRNTTVKKQTNE